MEIGCEIVSTYDIDPCTNEMTVHIPDLAWNPYIRQSIAFKSRK